MAEPALRLVGDSAADTFPWPGTGELLSFRDAHYRIDEQVEKNAALHKLVESQAVTIRRLEKRVAEDEDPATHPQGAEIVALIERWMRGTGHSKARVSADRVKAVKARLKDGYAITSDEHLPTDPTLELAVDGICSHPFVVNGQRSRQGTTSQRHDRLGICLGGGEKLEDFARLGYAARKAGWTPSGGWPA